MSSLQSENASRSAKHVLRRKLRARRRALPRWKRQQAAQRIAFRIMQQSWYRHARTLALYLANDAEIDPFPLIIRADAEGKCILLPRLRHQQLEFVRYRPRRPALRRNRFNIPEPTGRAVPLNKIDTICVPLVGFDRRGRRLGMGGGFYDRTFAKRRIDSARKLRGPRLIGLAYACQEVAQLPHEDWDVRMTGIVTEREWIPARR